MPVFGGIFNRFIKAPKEAGKEAENSSNKKAKSNAAEVAAFGTYASQSGEKFVYRAKKKGSNASGGYAIFTEETGGAATREDLLVKRMQKKSDR